MIEVGKNSLISDFSEEDYLDADGKVKEDLPFLCEVDAGAKDGEDYYVTLSSGTKITLKAPELEKGDVGYNEVKNYVKTKFEKFLSAQNATGKELTDIVDVDSVAKLYLINELGKNWDAGVSSFYFTYKQGEDGNYKFYGSPVWDYDNSLGNATGVEWDLRSMGVSDYQSFDGWWCKFKGKASNETMSYNIINNLARNKEVQATATRVWFEDFMPALRHFAGTTDNAAVSGELYSSEQYFALLRDCADMNYTSGWLLNTGKWIADHSTLYKASYDPETKKMVVDMDATAYEQTFDDMFAYAFDWMEGRAAWLSEKFAPDYTPSVLIGDADRDGSVTIAEVLQPYMGGKTVLIPKKIKNF
jgi:hypothetical protein